MSTKPVIDIEKFPLLEGIDDVNKTRILANFQMRMAQKGETVLYQGTSGENLLFLFTGRLQVLNFLEDGKEFGLSFLDPGDYFGELSVIDNLTRSASVVALEESSYALLPRQFAFELICKNPKIAERVLIRLASLIRKDISLRSIASNPNAFHRVFALIDHLAKTGLGGLVVIEQLPRHHEIAIMANTTRETVSRALRVLINQGVIEKDLRRLIIRQPDALRKAIEKNRS